MDDHVLSNAELSDLKKRLNEEIKRRSTFTWWDPLVPPTVGTDRESRKILPSTNDDNTVVTEYTYTINNPSSGSLEQTRNRLYPMQGENPAGQDTDGEANPKTSATRFDVDEVRNYLVGLTKIHDVDLYYGRDEQAELMFRDPEDIQRKLEMAESDINNEPLVGSQQQYDHNAGITNRKRPGYGQYPIGGNTGHYVTMPNKLPSGQYDGEEILPGHTGPDPNNFYDDFGATVENTNMSQLTGDERRTVPAIHDSQQIPDNTPTTSGTSAPTANHTATVSSATQTPSGVRSTGWQRGMESLPGQPFKRSYNGGADRMVNNSRYNGKHPSQVSRPQSITPLSGTADQDHLSYHPQNPYVSAEQRSFRVDQDQHRNETVTETVEGSKDSNRFGLNPRNPMRGDEYSSQSYRQVFVGKAGLCHVSCTGMCYETCDSECTESCQSTCWNRCGDACISSCSNVCTSCSNLCYQGCYTKCQGITGYSCLNLGARTVSFISSSNWPRNDIQYTVHSCSGCSYTCQYYPNYKTTCWDAMCQNMCFYSCYSYCSTACYGGCIDNVSQHNHDTSPTGSGSTQKKNEKKGEGAGQGGGTLGQQDQPFPHANYNNGTRYKTGRGQACREACVADCVGTCTDTCLGDCNISCFDKCKVACHDTCDTKCETTCGKEGCSHTCRKECKGSCGGSCNNVCRDATCKASCEEVCAESCIGGCEGTCYGSCLDSCIGTAV